MANELRRNATIGDVAREASVSVASVSRVVNGLATVDPAIAARVRDAIARLNYVPSSTARALSLGVTHTIGMVIPDLGNPLFQQILAGFNRAAAAVGYRVLVADSQETAADEAALAREARRRADAVVLCAPRMPAHELAALIEELGNVVVINREHVAPAAAVTVDYTTGIHALLTHLAALGHTRMLYLAGPDSSASNAARLAGLDRFATTNPQITVERVACGSSMDAGYRAWDTVRASDATAVLAFNDVVAMGLLGRLSELRIPVPEQLSVTGFDDIGFARFATPPLTTMAVPQQRIGEVAWEQLRILLDGGTSGPAVRFTPELVVRQSTGAPRR